MLKAVCILFALCAMTGITSLGQTFNNLASFDETNGAGPYLMSLTQGVDGNYYGTASGGGKYGGGTVFKVTAAGKISAVYSFCTQSNCTDGDDPFGGLVLATDGNFYGTTLYGGKNGDGAVFKVTASGTLTTLYSFCSQSGCTDGYTPWAGLVQGTDGNFYGTTYSGGTGNNGTVFKITAAGKLTTLYRFCSKTGCTDGATPIGGLIQGTDGNFYGTTSTSGKNDYGTVFKITAAGKLTTVYNFCSHNGCTDGANPYAGLVQGSDGYFYGTTTGGGKKNDGTVFEVTAAGKLTTLYNFCSQAKCTDGDDPLAGLFQGTDGNFYGTTRVGGKNNSGTVFNITPAGNLTTFYSFCSQSGCTDGQYPYGGLLQATSGIFYGTTYDGGSRGDGTVYDLSMGLGPFVAFVNNPGKVGATVEILGQGFTGTTGVSFNGTSAKFTVVSDTYLTATVPTGATTGTVTVTTPGGNLDSNVAFRVTPQIKSFTPTSGPVGTEVTITGVSLTQTTQVTFGGVPATNFTVNSDTQVTAYVPSGAKTGKIGITTLGGTVLSSGTFTVTQ